MTRAAELIERLALQPTERGFFVETYRAAHEVVGAGSAPRAASTAIYFLLTAEQPRSYLHRLAHDELFHLYEGGPLDVLLLAADGSSHVARLGRDVAAGERPQLTIPAGTWFGTELPAGISHVLFGCTVAPGFDFADFELAEGPELATRYPEQQPMIARLTRPARII